MTTMMMMPLEDDDDDGGGGEDDDADAFDDDGSDDDMAMIAARSSGMNKSVEVWLQVFLVFCFLLARPMAEQKRKSTGVSQPGGSAQASEPSRDSGVSLPADNESSRSTDLSAEEMWTRLMRNFVLEQDRVQNTVLLQELRIPLATEKLPHATSEQLSCGHERVHRSGSQWFSAAKCKKCDYRGFYLPSSMALVAASTQNERVKKKRQQKGKAAAMAKQDCLAGESPPDDSLLDPQATLATNSWLSLWPMRRWSLRGLCRRCMLHSCRQRSRTRN